MPIIRTKSGGYLIGLNNAYSAGLRAGRANLPLSMNPYKRFEHRQQWEQGWLKGQMEDEG